MTRVYNQCGYCGKWDREKDMDYFTGYGLCCNDCRNKFLSEDIKKKERERID